MQLSCAHDASRFAKRILVVFGIFWDQIIDRPISIKLILCIYSTRDFTLLPYAAHVKRTGTKLICDKFQPERRYVVYDREDSIGELLIAVKYGAPHFRATPRWLRRAK